MVAFAKDGMTPTVLLIESKNEQRGWHLAFIPDNLDAADTSRAFDEIGITPDRVCEIDKWEESEEGVVVGWLPFPER
jgi:hypothetical protein